MSGPSVEHADLALTTGLAAASVPEGDLDSTGRHVPAPLARRTGTAGGVADLAGFVARVMQHTAGGVDRVPCPTTACWHCGDTLRDGPDRSVTIHAEDGARPGCQSTKQCPKCKLTYGYNMAVKTSAGGRRSVFIDKPDNSFFQFTPCTVYDWKLVTRINPMFTNFTSATSIAEMLAETNTMRESTCAAPGSSTPR